MRIPVGKGFAGRIAARAATDHDRRRRPCGHPQPDPAREGDPVAARRAAARGGTRARRAARRQLVPRRSPTRNASCSNSPATAPRSRSRTPGCSSSSGWRRRFSAGCCRTCATIRARAGQRATSPQRSGPSAATGTTLQLGGGRVAVVAGDVVGHGVAAAAVMAQLRTATARLCASRATRPRDVVERVNRLDLGPRAADDDDARVSSSSTSSASRSRWSIAGHPPPLIDLPRRRGGVPAAAGRRSPLGTSRARTLSLRHPRLRDRIDGHLVHRWARRVSGPFDR